MVFRTLLVAAILYFAVKAILNLIAAVRKEVNPPERIPEDRFYANDPYVAPTHRTPEAAYRKNQPDIEDAQWEDVT